LKNAQQQLEKQQQFTQRLPQENKQLLEETEKRWMLKIKKLQDKNAQLVEKLRERD
jgi:hypothetical protein